jgi:hypothetical protein
VKDLNPLSVIIFSRATRIVGAACILVWLIAGGVTFFTDPNFTSRSIPEMIQSLEPTALLYLFPGLILVMLGAIVKGGRLWPAPIIFLISILSLFKLVLLLVPIHNTFLKVPLYYELPPRIACALLSVLCVFAWEDLAEMNRTRARRGNSLQFTSPPPSPGLPRIPRPTPRPPPPSKIPRHKIRPEEPPSSQTPWS